MPKFKIECTNTAPPHGEHDYEVEYDDETFAAIARYNPRSIAAKCPTCDRTNVFGARELEAPGIAVARAKVAHAPMGDPDKPNVNARPHGGE